MGKKSFFIKTYGCQMNQHDSLQMKELLLKEGFEEALMEEGADVILLNTCCVRAHAEQRASSYLWNLKPLKERRSEMFLGVGGCWAEKEGGNLLKSIPHLDLVFGLKSLYQLPNHIREVEKRGTPLLSLPEAQRPLLSSQCPEGAIKAFLTIMEGCDNFCSYCIVPYVRGPRRSKPVEQVISEASEMVQKGVKEITLLGQNVNSYGQDLSPPASFPELLERLNEIEGLIRLRFTTSHPKDLSSQLISALKHLPGLCEHLHLPLQSGSNPILERMNRGYTYEQYRELTHRLRHEVPHIAITTDLIVAFPGEGEREHQDNIRALEEIRFDGAYIFKFSARKGTKAFDLENHVEQREKEKRHREILSLQKDISAERLRQFQGQRVRILVEGLSQKASNGLLFGRTRQNRHATLKGEETLLVGKEVEAQVQEVNNWNLCCKRA